MLYIGGYMNNDVNVETDFLEFFGKPYEEVIEPIQKYVRMGCNEDYIKREAFAKYQPKNREELAKLYDSDEMVSMYARNIGDNWFTALSQISEEEKRVSYIYKMAYDLFSDKREVSIIDYGCGSAIYAFKLLFQGFSNITIADIPHRHFKFLKFLCEKYQIKMKFLPLEGDSALTEKYDYIINSEVLEHVWEPEEVLVHMIEHMKDDGWMYLSTFFDDMRGQDPTHLVQNTKRYNNPDVWLSKVRDHGLVPRIFDMNGVPKGFQKI